MSAVLPPVQFSHTGFHCVDLDAMEAFYTSTLGFIASDRGVASTGHRLVFMTQNPAEHHQLVMFDGKPDNLAFNPVNQLSFLLRSLEDLRTFHAILVERGHTDIAQVDHGNAWSMYFKDPEGNPIELFVDTPFYTPQPCKKPLDLSLPADEILRRTEAMCRERPDFKTREQWMESIRQRIAAERH